MARRSAPVPCRSAVRERAPPAGGWVPLAAARRAVPARALSVVRAAPPDRDGVEPRGAARAARRGRDASEDAARPLSGRSAAGEAEAASAPRAYWALPWPESPPGEAAATAAALFLRSRVDAGSRERALLPAVRRGKAGAGPT